MQYSLQGSPPGAFQLPGPSVALLNLSKSGTVPLWALSNQRVSFGSAGLLPCCLAVPAPSVNLHGRRGLFCLRAAPPPISDADQPRMILTKRPGRAAPPHLHHCYRANVASAILYKFPCWCPGSCMFHPQISSMCVAALDDNPNLSLQFCPSLKIKGVA